MTPPYGMAHTLKVDGDIFSIVIFTASTRVADNPPEVPPAEMSSEVIESLMVMFFVSE
jgi:hypothetical protein